jgi:hypothetical protein
MNLRELIKRILKKGLDDKWTSDDNQTVTLDGEKEEEVSEYSRTLKNARQQGVGLRFPKSAIKSNPLRFRHYNK